MIETSYIPVPTGRKTEDRKAYIYVPDMEPEGGFPVLYMFDGHNVFFDTDATYGKSWGMGEYLDAHGVPLIVAAIDCNHHRNNGRLREYSPYAFQDDTFGRIRGTGKHFLDWFSGEFKFFVDDHYPTLPNREFTFVAGSSMGGLMALYALCEYSDVYSRAAALSPSVWVNTSALVQDITRAELLDESVLYMDYGSEELQNHEMMLPQLEKVQHAFLQKGCATTFRIVPGGTHCEACWEEQLPFFMPMFFYTHQA